MREPVTICARTGRGNAIERVARQADASSTERRLFTMNRSRCCFVWLCAPHDRRSSPRCYGARNETRERLPEIQLWRTRHCKVPHTFTAPLRLEGKLPTDTDDTRHTRGLRLIELAEARRGVWSHHTRDIRGRNRSVKKMVGAEVDGVIEDIVESRVDVQVIALPERNALAELHIEERFPRAARAGKQGRRVAESRIVERAGNRERIWIEIRCEVGIQSVFLPALIDQWSAGNDIRTQRVARGQCTGRAVLRRAAGRAAIRAGGRDGDEVAHRAERDRGRQAVGICSNARGGDVPYHLVEKPVVRIEPFAAA